MKRYFPILILCLAAFSQTAFGHCMKSDYYAGGGIALSTLPAYQKAAGFQFMGGFCMPYNFNNKKVKTSVELGYFDMGDFSGNNGDRSFEGLWSTGVVEYKSTRKIHFLGRGGLDFGSDDGLIYGMGMAINVTKFAQFRSEFVFRDESKSLQFSLVSEFQ